MRRLRAAAARIGLGCAAALASACSSETTPAGEPALPDGPVPLGVLAVEDLGALPLPSETVAGRDGASSGLVGGTDLLWTFGDTFVYEPTPVDGSNVVSATGGWAKRDTPFELVEPVDEQGIPGQLIPYTDEEIAQNQASPLDGWALWPGAVIDTGDDALLVLFQRIKRTAGTGFDGVGVGTARIAPTQTAAERSAGDLFSRPLPPETGGTPLYGTGGVAVAADMAYLFACEQIEPLNVGCRLARAPRADADDRAAFEFFDGSGWSPEVGAAAVMIDQVGVALSVSYNPHLRRYLCVTSQLLSNDLVLRTADRIEGPWLDAGVVVSAADGGILPAGEGSNYLAQEHVALRSDDGRQIVVSYSRPLGNFRGEVRLARITLE